MESGVTSGSNGRNFPSKVGSNLCPSPYAFYNANKCYLLEIQSMEDKFFPIKSYF